ncbi:hypothetical protein ZHAS_00000571 [Anopheles sinensis]|uniref:Uncharacterized protein n=1 Tax=Anopheles sinensis TaxID=74873 RepID=A0A084VA95_ANOSI|nr:hypothetical protein ZHAS_00000571 [Anopheles sinensis]
MSAQRWRRPVSSERNVRLFGVVRQSQNSQPHASLSSTRLPYRTHLPTADTKLFSGATLLSLSLFLSGEDFLFLPWLPVLRKAKFPPGGAQGVRVFVSVVRLARSRRAPPPQAPGAARHPSCQRLCRTEVPFISGSPCHRYAVRPKNQHTFGRRCYHDTTDRDDGWQLQRLARMLNGAQQQRNIAVARWATEVFILV